MKLSILSVVVALASAGRLENTYLPPKSFGAVSRAPIFASVQSRQPSSFVSSAQIPILKLQNDNNGDGTYRFSFETANHIVQQETGHLKSADSSTVQGSYSYTAPDGQTYTVNYVADENGYRADGAHLPTPPPISEVILKSLQQNAVEEAARGRSGDVLTNQYLPPKQGGYRF
ncbi:unnamed protein product [Tenebrio molitor]|nr:unnamed protein product [Tenebrio molitor]